MTSYSSFKQEGYLLYEGKLAKKRLLNGDLLNITWLFEKSLKTTFKQEYEVRVPFGGVVISPAEYDVDNSPVYKIKTEITYLRPEDGDKALRVFHDILWGIRNLVFDGYSIFWNFGGNLVQLFEHPNTGKQSVSVDLRLYTSLDTIVDMSDLERFHSFIKDNITKMGYSCDVRVEELVLGGFVLITKKRKEIEFRVTLKDKIENYNKLPISCRLSTEFPTTFSFAGRKFDTVFLSCYR